MNKKKSTNIDSNRIEIIPIPDGIAQKNKRIRVIEEMLYNYRCHYKNLRNKNVSKEDILKELESITKEK